MKRKIKEFMVTAEIVDEREAEVVEFGLDMLKTVLLGGVVVIGAGAIFGILKETLLFVALLMLIRQYAGGFHAKTRLKCALMSIVLLFLSVAIFQYVSLSWQIQIFLYLCGLFLIIRYAPVENAGKPLDDLEVKTYGKRMKWVLTAESFLFILLMVLKLFTWSFVLVLAIVLAAALVIAGHLQNKSA